MQTPFHILFAEPCCLGVHSNPFLSTCQLLFRSFSVNFAPTNLGSLLSDLLECLNGKGGQKTWEHQKGDKEGNKKEQNRATVNNPNNGLLLSVLSGSDNKSQEGPRPLDPSSD